MLALLVAALAMTGVISVEIASDGFVAIRYTLSLPEAPIRVNLTVPPGGDLAIAKSGDEPVPVEYDAQSGYLSFPALSRDAEVAIYYSALTQKKGAIWSVELPPQPFAATVSLPKGAVPVSIEPRDFRAEIRDGRLYLHFRPGERILVEYIIPPASPVLPITQPSQRLPLGALYLLFILAAAGAAYLLLRRKQGDYEDLDERDRAILGALERGELSAQEIQRATGIPKTPLYRRLEKLERMGKIEAEQRGSVKIYRLKRG